MKPMKAAVTEDFLNSIDITDCLVSTSQMNQETPEDLENNAMKFIAK